MENVEICDAPVTAEQVYDYVDGKLIPSWEFAMDMKSNADYWQIRVDLNTGNFTSKNDPYHLL